VALVTFLGVQLALASSTFIPNNDVVLITPTSYTVYTGPAVPNVISYAVNGITSPGSNITVSTPSISGANFWVCGVAQGSINSGLTVSFDHHDGSPGGIHYLCFDIHIYYNNTAIVAVAGHNIETALGNNKMGPESRLDNKVMVLAELGPPPGRKGHKNQ
jgi:hypothetical protein